MYFLTKKVGKFFKRNKIFSCKPQTIFSVSVCISLKAVNVLSDRSTASSIPKVTSSSRYVHLNVSWKLLGFIFFFFSHPLMDFSRRRDFLWSSQKASNFVSNSSELKSYFNLKTSFKIYYTLIGMCSYVFIFFNILKFFCHYLLYFEDSFWRISIVLSRPYE